VTPTLEQLDALAEAMLGPGTTMRTNHATFIHRHPRHGAVLRALAVCFGVPLPQDDAMVLRHERLPADEARAAMAKLEAAMADPSPPATARPGRPIAELRTELLRLGARATLGTLRPSRPDETAFKPGDVLSDDGQMPLLIASMNENIRYDDDRAYLCATWNAVPKLLEGLITLEMREATLRAENAQLRAEREALTEQVNALQNPPFGTRKIG
jgi:hypothetical protein